MNFVSIIGNLTANPKIRTTQTNDGDMTIVNFSIALNNGKNQEATFINCVAFNQKATLIKDHTMKGSKLGIVGKLSSRTYDRQDGTKATTIEIIVDSIDFLTPKAEEQEPVNKGTFTAEENEKDFADLPLPDDLPF